MLGYSFIFEAHFFKCVNFKNLKILPLNYLIVPIFLNVNFKRLKILPLSYLIDPIFTENKNISIIPLFSTYLLMRLFQNLFSNLPNLLLNYLIDPIFFFNLAIRKFCIF